MSSYLKVKVRDVRDDNLNGMYVAGPAGIYKMRNVPMFIIKRFGAYFLIVVGILSLFDILIKPIYGLISLVLIALGVYLLYTMTIDLELKIPWNSVRDVVVTNARTQSVPRLFPLPHFKSYLLGDLQIILTDGSVTKISRVTDAYNKVDYIKARYMQRT
ncbi:MAG: hypothetical protein OWQ54_00360 [Sulfolobaceae archaeon]|nr:hypothetical protein [Sulfolobaceae archaeon]